MRDASGRFFLMLAAFVGFLAVALGAFGAHSLKSHISPEMLRIYQTAVQYQMFHCGALLFTGLLLHLGGGGSRLLLSTAWFFLFGLLLFCGSLYGMAITGIRWLGAITPLGGMSFMAGWACLVIFMYRAKHPFFDRN